MTSLSQDDTARYSDETLARLFPDKLKLVLVQVLFRHGERSPVRVRLENAGIPRHFNLCSHVNQFNVAVQTGQTGNWSRLAYQREIEESGPDGKANGVASEQNTCLLGELTDRGRTTTFALGRRLRDLYCERLKFLPEVNDLDEIYLRSSPMPRALESLQQVVSGMYPVDRLPHACRLRIYQRNFTEENLFPNEGACRKLRKLSEEYAAIAAEKWNPVLALRTSEIFSKYETVPIRLDGNPRLSGLMDTINATRANGLPVPDELLDKEMLDTMHRAVVEEWFGGYLASATYRRLGAGRLLGDLRNRVIDVISHKSPLRVALYGAHDTTLGSLLATMATSDYELHWPPFTSHIALEAFEERRDSGILSSLKSKQYFVRMRYNNTVVPLKGCQNPEMCTLAEFNDIVDSLVPKDWQAECQS